MAFRQFIINKPLGLAVLCGILSTAAFPDLGFYWTAWVALAPLLLAINGLSGFNRFRLGFLAGFIHYTTLVYWAAYTMNTYGGLPWAVSIPIMLLLAAYLSLYFGLFALLCRWLPKTCFGFLLVMPCLWVSLEYIRSFLLSGFPWELTGYSQYPLLRLIQISDITGVYGISFMIAGMNAACALLVLSLSGKTWQGIPINRSSAVWGVVFWGIVLGGAFGYGTWRLGVIENRISQADRIPIAVVQGNIDQSIKWDPRFQASTTQKYIDLSLKALSENPELIVWPETATPFYFTFDMDLTQRVQSAIIQAGRDFLIGSPSFTYIDRILKYYNSAFLVGSDGKVIGKYDKAHLVPFGEYVPLKKWLPFIGKIVEHVGDFEPGKKGAVLDWKNRRLGILICFEIIFPELSRAAAENGADLFVNLTNDAWYGKTSAPYQHFSMAIFRSVENRRSLIRCANTGISAFIEPSGRIFNATGLYEDATATRNVPLITTQTLYTRFGDLFCQICMGVFAISLLIGYFSNKFIVQKSGS